MLHKTLPGASGGGVVWQVHGLANELVKRGHHVTAFAFCDKPADALYEVQCIGPSSVLNGRAAKLYAPPLYYARHSYDSFDLVHAHGDDHLMLNRCRPHVRTFYGSALGEAAYATSNKVRMLQLTLYPLEIMSAILADARVGISQNTSRYIPRIDSIVPCGIDLNVFRPGMAKSDNPSILFVGTLEGRKRGRLLLEVFLRFVSKELRNAELWMVCEDVRNGGYQQGRVKFFRRLPTEVLVELYQKAWVFCLPSTYEGFGVPYIEAMATGTPVVSTPNAGALEVLDGGRCGVIVREAELGATLVDLLVNQELRLRLAKAGLRWVPRFAWENVARQYEEVYEQAICKSHRKGDGRNV